MRIYLPATAAHLRASVLGSSHQPLTAHAATPALAQALPEEDEEGLEVSASLCAADASVVLLAEPEAAGLADRRIVIAADVEAENVRELPVEGDVLPGTIEVTGEISWEDVAALLVDEPEAQDDECACPLFVSPDHILDRGLHGLDLAGGEEESEDAQKEGEHRGETLTA